MKKHLLIFFLAALLAVGLSERNNSASPGSDGFPASAQTELSANDDPDKAEAAREANSLFVLPTAHVAAAGDHSQQNFRTVHPETTAFTFIAALRDTPAPAAETTYTIARNGAFHRPSDYYVYALRHITV